MGKKKRFIYKKKSATFQLLSRDTSDPNYSSDPSSERVFIRVDNNGGVNPDSIFADAPEDCDGNFDSRESSKYKDQNTALPDHVRKEILELGFPDDGYDYLIHMREIKNKGGGSNYYDNPKASFLQLERDVKAYDSSMVEVRKLNDVSIEKSIYSVAAKTVGVRLQKVLDADVAAMLDDSDSSKFGSDVEDLEEDFVVKANLVEGAGDDDIDAQLNLAGGLMAINGDFTVPENVDAKLGMVDEKARIRRPLDEQFDLHSFSGCGQSHAEAPVKLILFDQQLSKLILFLITRSRNVVSCFLVSCMAGEGRSTTDAVVAILWPSLLVLKEVAKEEDELRQLRDKEDELRQLRDKYSRYIRLRVGFCFLKTAEEKIQHILKCYPELQHEIDRILKQNAESEDGEDFTKEDENGGCSCYFLQYQQKGPQNGHNCHQSSADLPPPCHSREAGDDVPTSGDEEEDELRQLRDKEDELRQLRDKYSRYIRLSRFLFPENRRGKNPTYFEVLPGASA
ncbi:hypothetical protein F511_13646 [Dorcoceras hygrometricum]|uniref:Tyrosine specific protein phosphatases domain-containing protein n=1 Tax=Dorcoceras hygrometricum TaxID=472368 RepID=A0A2Z7B399_9LAMI|nr:hypothetical protein F511_13646 [Dorcoceras hygrometricum]